MPFIERDDARIHWYEMGRGEPIVMIMGLGCSSAMWFRLAPLLARDNRVILLDNRGSGQTQVKYFVTHRITAMAEDVVAVLDAAGERTRACSRLLDGRDDRAAIGDRPSRPRAHADAARHPLRQRQRMLADRWVTNLLFEKASTPEQSLNVMAPYVYARDTPDSSSPRTPPFGSPIRPCATTRASSTGCCTGPRTTACTRCAPARLCCTAWRTS